MMQFSKAPNVYFLAVTFMQMIKAISITDGKPMQGLPLVAIIFISMLKDAFEDYKRHKSDDQENNATSNKFNY